MYRLSNVKSKEVRYYMEFAKKYNSTQVKIGIKEKLDTKRRNKRCPSAGIFCTSSAGAVISLIFRNKIVSAASSLILMFLFCSLIGIFSLTGTTDILGLGGSAYAADSINLNIDTNSLSLDTMSTSTTGNFATSSNMNISVSTTSEKGYTLSMRSATGSTSLVNTTDSGKTINSISSSVTPTNYADDAYASANNLNNTWGYLPSKYNSAANSNFLPLPTATAQIIETTDSANPTANTYTLSFGTRVNNETAVGSYKNDSFVIIAIANIVPLTINYNANGGYFGSSTSTTLNTVAYDATSEGGTETITKYAHTPNVSDAGVASTTYANNLNTTDTVTIDGATQLTVTIYYDAESTSYDWVTVYQSPFTISDSNDATVSTTTGNLSGKLSGRNSNRTSTYSSWYTKTYTVSGDTVKFHFKSDSSQVYYGYYAIVTAEVDSTTYSKTAISGSYATPNNSDSSLTFVGWTENQDGSGTVYADESEVSTKLPYVNGDPAVTLYAKWKYPDMQTMTASDCSTTPKTVTDSRDNKEYTVARLADGKCWMTSNLNLAGGTALSADDTDVSSSYISSFSTSNNLTKTGSTIVLPASSQSGFNTNNYSYVYNSTSTDCSSSTGCYGYYSWDAATLGSGRNISMYNRDAPQSICPKGWRLPRARDNQPSDWRDASDFYSMARHYGLNNTDAPSDQDSTSFYTLAGQGTVPNFMLAGQYSSSNSLVEGGLYGRYWSATSRGSSEAFGLMFSGTRGVYAGSSYYRYAGQSVRCVMKAPTMQSATSASLAAAMPNNGDTTTLQDERDGQEYSITKIGGDYWMTTNLNLAGGTALSADDTDVASSYITSFSTSNNLTKSGNAIILPASSTSGFYTVNYSYVYNSGSTTCASNTPCYSYYTWDAATLGSGRSITTDNTDAPYSICPKGWHLPNTRSGTDNTSDFRKLMITLGGSATIQDYTSSSSPTGTTISSSLRANPNNFLLSGLYENSTFYDGGSTGTFWSATKGSDSRYARNLSFSTSDVHPADDYYSYYGRSVRCLFGS